MRTRLAADAVIPRGLQGRVVLCRANGPLSVPAEIEWFAVDSIQAAGGWVVPETVNGFYYVLES